MNNDLPEAEQSPAGKTNDWQSAMPMNELAQYWLSALIESAEDAIITKTLDSVITSWNKGAEALFGYTAEEAVGRSITMLIPAYRAIEALARARGFDPDSPPSLTKVTETL